MQYLAVFAYSFPHRKTQDFLLELISAGCKKIFVIGAPWKPMPISGNERLIKKRIKNAESYATSTLCKNLGLDYFEVNHDDVEHIGGLMKKYDSRMALISGARILSSSIVDMFSDGIINFHPGKIPETSGLDAFFYAIKNRVSMGVTTHFIDARVDAGNLIFFDEIKLDLSDAPDIIQENMHHAQIMALRKVVQIILQGGEIRSTPVFRPSKNSPMTAKEKLICLEEFPRWLAEQYRQQNCIC